MVIWVWILLFLMIGDRMVLIWCWMWFFILLVNFNCVLLRLWLLVLDCVSRWLDWLIRVMFFSGKLVIVLEIRCIMVLICFLFSVCFGFSVMVMEVEGDFCFCINSDGFGIVRWMWVFFIGFSVLIVWVSLFFSVCW